VSIINPLINQNTLRRRHQQTTCWSCAAKNIGALFGISIWQRSD